MITHKTKACVVVGADTSTSEGVIVTVATEGRADFILPAGFRFTWTAVDFAQAHRERKRK